jgi:Family of unknown function (DUF6493)
MNTVDLKELIDNKDLNRAIDLFARLSDSERESLAAEALLLNTYARASIRHYEEHDLMYLTARLSHSGSLPRDMADPIGHEIANLAVLAICSLNQIKNLGYFGMSEPDSTSLVLMARKPEWLKSWCEFALEVAPTSHWLVVYKLERDLDLSLAHDSLYLSAMCAGLASLVTMMDFIQGEAKIRNELIWSMFSDPICLAFLSNPERMMASDSLPGLSVAKSYRFKHQNFSREVTNNWLRCMKDLLHSGALSREKAQAVAFTALAGCADDEDQKSIYAPADSSTVLPEHQLTTRDWQNQTDFCIALCKICFNQNNPEQEAKIASLCGARNSKVSQYALEKLLLTPVANLPIEKILSNIPRVFQGRKKTSAGHALRLLQILLKDDLGEKRKVAEALVCALDHKSPDIQKRALSLLRQYFVEVPNWLQKALEARLANLTGLNRQLAISMTNCIKLKDNTSIEYSKEDSEDNRQILDKDHHNLLEKAACYNNPKLAPLIDLDEAISDFRQAHLPSLKSAELWTYDFPRLDPEKMVVPIDNEDDLIFSLARLLEGFASPLAEERCMDGVSRLCASHSEHFTEKTIVLQQKIERLFAGEVKHFTERVRPWHNLIRSYLQVGVVEGYWTYDFFLDQRIQELCHRVDRGIAAPLLATPTHSDGWLAPTSLVERLLIWQHSDLELARAELIQAILRLAPEGRAEALEKAQALTGLTGEVVRYALGGNDFHPEQKHSLWIAAFRAREPFGSNLKLSQLLPGLPPDGSIAAIYTLDDDQLNNAKRYSYNIELPNFLRVQSFDPDFPSSRERNEKAFANVSKLYEVRGKYSLLPTCLLHDNASPFAPVLRPHMWPQNRESFLVILAKRLVNREVQISEASLDLLFHPDQPMTGNGKWWLCRAFSSTDERIAGIAVDLLIACINENRIEPISVAETLNAFMIAEQVNLGHVVSAFRRASKISSLHAFFVWETVTSFLSIEFPNSVAARLQWLELLVDLNSEFGFESSSRFKSKLKDLGSGGKTKTVCDLLINANSGPVESVRKTIARQYLEHKLARLDRWSRWAKASQSTSAFFITPRSQCGTESKRLDTPL